MPPVDTKTARMLNSIGLLVVCGVLVAAYYFQIALDELPCPLCLLQRVAFVAVGYGLCLNVIRGPRPHHYGIMILAAMYGAGVSTRQVLLHIVPGTGSYGSPVLGLHFYTWAALCFFLVILGSAVMLLFDRQFATDGETRAAEKFGGSALAKFAFACILILAVANAATTFPECGAFVCAESLTGYKVLQDLKSG